MCRRKPSKIGQNYFEVTWLDEPIESFRVDAQQLPLGIGVWFERREAARFALYKWHEFLELPDGEQAGIIAHYRMHNRIESMANDYLNKKSTRVK